MAQITSPSEILDQLRATAKPGIVAGMARFGLSPENRLGLSMPEIRKIAKRVGKDHALATHLWETGIHEARILASMVADPAKLTERQLNQWVRELDSWDVCDEVCMNLFVKAPLARHKIVEWSRRKEEFVKRAAFALLACWAWHEKDASDATFSLFLPLIEESATDQRHYVRKAVNWALRNIGKRNVHLNKAAIKTALRMQHLDSKAVRWIAADALRELRGESVQRRINATRLGR